MLASIVTTMIRLRLVVVVIALALCGAGIYAAKHLSVDAFPDVTNIQVQVATVAIGRSPEEMERLVTVPVEIAMTGLPGLVEMRSMNKSGLSLITLVFTDKTDVYALGVMLYEMLSGERPITGQSHGEIIANHLVIEPMPLVSKMPQLPSAVTDLVASMLCKNRDLRPPMAKVAEVLDGLCVEHPPPVKRRTTANVPKVSSSAAVATLPPGQHYLRIRASFDPTNFPIYGSAGQYTVTGTTTRTTCGC